MYWIKPSIRNAIRVRDNSRCAYCNRHVPKKQRSLDHVEPRSKGGCDDHWNLVLTCKSCNSQKKDRSLNDYCEYLVLEGFMSYQSAQNIKRRVANRLEKGI